MKSILKTFGIKNIKAYYWASFFSYCFFMFGNWLFFYERIVTRQQMGVIAAVSTIAGILFEIPSGALADLLGKKSVVQIGLILPIFCYLVALLFPSFTGFLVSEIFIIISFAFLSGSLEAFGYDTLVECKQAKHFDYVESRRRIVSSLALVISSFVGGLLYSLDIRYPWIASIIAFSLGTFGFTVLATEPKVDTYQFSLSQYKKQLVRGMKELFSSKTSSIIIPIVTFQIIFYLMLNVFKQAFGIYWGFEGERLSYILGVTAFTGILVGFIFPYLNKKLGVNKGYIVSYAFYFVVLLLSAIITPTLMVGALAIIMVYSLPEFTLPLGSVALNKVISSKVRATTISTLAMISQVPYIILFLFFSDTTLPNSMPKLLLVYSSFIGVSFLIFIVLKIKESFSRK